MSCERYKKALIEAGASGEVWPGDGVGEHLNACTDCRAFFAREQGLFAAIDISAHRVSNITIPPSLVSRLEATLPQQQKAKHGLLPVWTYALAAASLLIMIFVAHNWRQSDKVVSVEIATQIITPYSNAPTLQQSNSVVPSAVGEWNHRFHSDTRKLSHGDSQNPEVLVQPGEEEQLIHFYEAMQAPQHGAPTVVAQESDAPLRHLEIAPIEIARLEIENLPERGDVSR